SPALVTIDRANPLNGVACTSPTQCTAVGTNGRETTFDPASPGTPQPAAVDSTSGAALIAVACPSAAQCTAVDDNGNAVTFDPGSPGGATTTTIDSGGYLPSIAC